MLEEEPTRIRQAPHATTGSQTARSALPIRGNVFSQRTSGEFARGVEGLMRDGEEGDQSWLALAACGRLWRGPGASRQWTDLVESKVGA